MRIGLIARADLSRGLGSQTHSFFTHLDPYKTLIVDMGDRTPYHQSFDLYSGRVLTTTWRQDGSIDLPHIKWLLDEIDVLLTAETFYDPRIITMAEEKGVPTVCQANWEFAYWVSRPDLPRPTLFAFPSTWMSHRWPDNSLHLPFPIDLTTLPYRQRTHATHFLHVAGHPTRADRDGTHILFDAIPLIRRPVTLTITSQQPTFPRTVSGHITLHIIRGDQPSLTDYYTEADALVLPRRFGGQSLKLNEAAGTGCIPIMPYCSPQSDFLPPTSLVKSLRENHSLRTQSGNIPLYKMRPMNLANRIHELYDNPDTVAAASKQVYEWAQSISWEVMKPRYLEVFTNLIK